LVSAEKKPVFVVVAFGVFPAELGLDAAMLLDRVKGAVVAEFGLDAETAEATAAGVLGAVPGRDPGVDTALGFALDEGVVCLTGTAAGLLDGVAAPDFADTAGAGALPTGEKLVTGDFAGVVGFEIGLDLATTGIGFPGLFLLAISSVTRRLYSSSFISDGWPIFRSSSSSMELVW